MAFRPLPSSLSFPYFAHLPYDSIHIQHTAQLTRGNGTQGQGGPSDLSVRHAASTWPEGGKTVPSSPSAPGRRRGIVFRLCCSIGGHFLQRNNYYSVTVGTSGKRAGECGGGLPDRDGKRTLNAQSWSEQATLYNPELNYTWYVDYFKGKGTNTTIRFQIIIIKHNNNNNNNNNNKFRYWEAYVLSPNYRARELYRF